MLETVSRGYGWSVKRKIEARGYQRSDASASRCFDDAPIIVERRFSISRHAWERIHDHVVPHILEELDVVFNKDAPCWIGAGRDREDSPRGFGWNGLLS